MTRAYEVNFDGLIGPTHNYAGLSYGNVASMSRKGAASSPKQAALQGLAKMKLLADLGVKQAVLPPQERPFWPMIRNAGYKGTEAEMIAQAAEDAPQILASAYSASSMWAANAATVSPSVDCIDGKLHLTVANLYTQLHRSIEYTATHEALRRIFNDESRFVVHQPLLPSSEFGDEGAANHTRLCAAHDKRGIELFTFGRAYDDPQGTGPMKFPARQSRKACEAIAKQHGLDAAQTLFVQQNPAAIDAGVFHNDVVAVGNENLLLFHDSAYADTGRLTGDIILRFDSGTEKQPILIVVPECEVPLRDAVSSYLFNSQIVTLPDGSMSIVCPVECMEHDSTREFLDDLLKRSTTIRSRHVVDLRQSMRNGGGPACLRLRVVLTEEELKQVHQGVMWSPALHKKLVAWVTKHYRDELRPGDLRDPMLICEIRDALDELTKILDLPTLYPFQS